MKKGFLLIATGVVVTLSTCMISCGGNAESDAKKEEAAPSEIAMVDPAIHEGLELIGKSDCLTCHKINEAATGPAYAAVAAKYNGNQAGQDSLVNKIIMGGAGNWGQIMMPAHPQLAEADVKKMITYIMSVKAE